MKNAESTSWSLPDLDMKLDTGSGRTESDLTERVRLVKIVHRIAQDEGWSKAETSRRIDMSNSTFTDWYSGKYNGRIDAQNTKVAQWIDHYEKAKTIFELPELPDFIETRASKEIMNALGAAHVLKKIVMVHAESGIGKSETGKHYKKISPNVYYVEISPYAKNIYAALTETAEAVGVEKSNPTTLVSAIGNKLRNNSRVGSNSGGTLLIVDECQNLTNDAFNQFRHFYDKYDCGIALMGNSASYERYNDWGDDPMLAQLYRRIFSRVHIQVPYPEDIRMYIDAWGIKDEKQAEFLFGVGLKPGALGQVEQTVVLAKMFAAGAGDELSLKHLEAAWEKRGLGVVL